MLRIGITGHSNLTPDSIPLVAEALREKLAPRAGGGLIGVSCLARGADQIFARTVLDLGGHLEVILPAADYRTRKVKPDNAVEFDALINQANTVTTLPFDHSHRAAYMAASNTVLDTTDEIIAVWDGQPATGHGGTADVVDTARSRDLPVTVIWPTGAARNDA